MDLLARKPHVLVATPGRLLDLTDSGALTLGSCAVFSLFSVGGSGWWGPQQRGRALVAGPFTAVTTMDNASMSYSRQWSLMLACCMTP